MKKIKAYIELYKGKGQEFKVEPSLLMKKPLPREIKNAHEFNYRIYKCEIIIKEELK